MKQILLTLIATLLLTPLVCAETPDYLKQKNPTLLKVYVDSYNRSITQEELQGRVFRAIRLKDIEPVAGFAKAGEQEIDFNVVVDGTLFTTTAAAPFLVNVFIGTKVEHYGFVSTETLCRKFGSARRDAVLKALDGCVAEVLERYRESNSGS